MNLLIFQHVLLDDFIFPKNFENCGIRTTENITIITNYDPNNRLSEYWTYVLDLNTRQIVPESFFV